MSDKPKVEVLQLHLVSLQVCCQKGMTNEEIEAETNKIEPTGIKSPWRIYKCEADPERVQCAEDPAREHILLRC